MGRNICADHIGERVENFIITITCLVIGITLRRFPQFPEETGKVLNLFVIYVALPALVLQQIPGLSFSRDLLVPALMPWVMLFLSVFGVLVLSRILRWGREVEGPLLLLVPLGNTSFLGIPMVKAFFGDQAVSYAVLYDQLGSFPQLATYGSLILALYGTSESSPTVKEVLKKIITFPPFIALLLAVMLKPVAYPAIVHTLLQTLASTLVPVIMIAVGFQLTLRLNKGLATPLCLGLAI